MEKECELTKGKKNDFERIEEEEIVKVRNRDKAYKGGKYNLKQK